MLVVLDESSLQVSGSSVGGLLSLQGPEGSFPADRWYDCPLVVLAWWIEGLASVASGNAQSFRGDFMEGSFSFRVERAPGGSTLIAWGERGREQTLGIVNMPRFLASAVGAGEAVLRVCRARNWGSPRDLAELERVISRSGA